MSGKGSRHQRPQPQRRRFRQGIIGSIRRRQEADQLRGLPLSAELAGKGEASDGGEMGTRPIGGEANRSSIRLQASRRSIVQELDHAGDWFRRRPA